MSFFYEKPAPMTKINGQQSNDDVTATSGQRIENQILSYTRHVAFVGTQKNFLVSDEPQGRML